MPQDVWDYHVGGYRVCEKWLKDRKGRELGYDDIMHYRRIVAALAETLHIMRAIDADIEAHGGWPLGAASLEGTSERHFQAERSDDEDVSQ